VCSFGSKNVAAISGVDIYDRCDSRPFTTELSPRIDAQTTFGLGHGLGAGQVFGSRVSLSGAGADGEMTWTGHTGPRPQLANVMIHKIINTTERLSMATPVQRQSHDHRHSLHNTEPDAARQDLTVRLAITFRLAS
jgi:hypothetical protein